MKSWFNYSKYILSGLLLICMVCSCSKNEELEYNGKTATLSLNIPMSQSSSRAPIQGTAEENSVHNLRVVILSQGAESINKTFEKNDFASDGTVTIENVPVGKVQIYVIANEAALGKNYDKLANLQKDIVNGKVLILDENRTYFPKKGSEFNNENTSETPKIGLPMSWMDKDLTITPPAQEPQRVDVKLQRCVSKLNITMTNVSTEEDIVIKEMNFGAFMSDRIYLFQETNLDVPTDALYERKNYVIEETGITIPKNNGEKNLVLYIYPSFAWTDGNLSSPYSIGFKTISGLSYEPQYFMNDYALNSISRNTQVNITARLSKSKVVDLKFSVEPWSEETVEVPSFN